VANDKTLDKLLKNEYEVVSRYERENYILEPLFEETEFIRNDGIRNLTRALLLNVESFWDAPSAFSEDMNPPDEYRQGGAVLHTKRVFRLAYIMADSYELTEHQKDLVYSAALLHDITRAVPDENGNMTYDPLYPYTVDALMRILRKKDELHASENDSSTLEVDDTDCAIILRIIRCHRGPASPIPETRPVKENVLEMIVHLADRLATNLHLVIDGDEINYDRWRY
jgi:HD superfamily phosphohydrolase YqeK